MLNRFVSINNISGQIWANLISSLILKPDLPNTNLDSNSNVSKTMVSTNQYCGANGCPWHAKESSIIKPKMFTVSCVHQ